MKKKKLNERYYSHMKEVARTKEKPFEKRIETKYQSVIVIPKGYTLEDMMDMDDSIMGGEEPQYIKEVKVIFE
ncbi:MAG: hypothetical protein LUD50_01125 [Clostridia bacterium]|nr:hypothetical protein [Clostridia bacterium]